MAQSSEPESLRLDPVLAGLAPGARVGGGRFTLLSLLGQGGMGVVWLARDEHLGEDVALKFLPPEIRHDAVALDDLRRETSRSRKLTHSHIVRIYDLYKAEQEAFISMEYVEGRNLTERRLDQPERVLTWSFLEPLVKQLCDALHYAHGENIVHRDLKPANMMLDGRGRLKLADFGIAATVSDSISRVSMVRHGLSGTASYMSPQQLDGQLPQITDDIYSLGSTLYELLTSRAPFFTGDIPHQVRSLPPQPIEKRLAQLRINNPIPPAVSAAIMACLAKEPEKRLQSATAIARQLGLETNAELVPVSTRPAVTAAMAPAASATPPLPSTTPAPPLNFPPENPAGIPQRVEAAIPANPAVSAESAPVAPAPGPDLGRPRRALIAVGTLALLFTIVGGTWWQSKRPLPNTPSATPAPEFTTLFNGHDFSGWEGDPKFWSIQDGAITAIAGTSKDRRPVAVFWRGGVVDNFELRLSFRIESGNSGIYYRAKQLLANEVGGYQFEIAGDKTGVLLETGSDRMRREPSRRGSAVTASVVDGKEKLTVLAPTGSSALELQNAFRRTNWNDVVIIAQGNHLIHKLNGHTMVEKRYEFEKRPLAGTVALEVYGREPTKVQFRDIRLRKLPPDPIPDQAKPR